MVINDAVWVKIGKAVIFLGGVAGLIYTVVQLADRFSGPQLVAVVSVSEQFVHPEVRKKLEESLHPDSITKLIDAETKRGKSAKDIVESIRERAEDKDFGRVMTGLEFMMSKHMATITLVNESDEAAQDVRVILPGSGFYQVIEFLVSGSNDATSEWKGEIHIGTVRPQSRITVRVWPNDSYLWHGTNFLPAIMHKNGQGVVYQSHEFYGRDTEIVLWYLSQPPMIRYAIPIGAAVFIFWATWLAVRKKRLAFSLRGTLP